MSVGVPALPLGLDPLIAEAKERARRRRLIAAGVLVLAAGIAVAGVLSFGAGGGSGEVPWLPTQPDIGPADPPLAAACTASQLQASLFLQGATMSLAGPISIVNRSSRPCSLLGRPRLSFANATSRWREMRWTSAPSLFDPLAPPRRSLRALAPGEHVSVLLTWSNWCGRGARVGGVLTQSPAAIVLTPPGGGQVRLTNAQTGHGLPSPVCNGGAGSLSTLQAGSYTPFVPQSPPSSALPLKASIVSGPPFVFKGKRISQPSLTAQAGTWLSYTVVLTNSSKHRFRFGRTCPAYTEGVDAQNQAYILNCHSVGPIAPGQSVRFAMRVRVPAHPDSALPSVGWTLAPHSYNAPQTTAFLQIR
jgi:hypothetical protein